MSDGGTQHALIGSLSWSCQERDEYCGNLLVHRAHASKVRLRVSLPLPINNNA
jgi:hypothetical protein